MKPLDRFLKSCQATTAMTFALAAIPLFAVAGATVDYSRAYVTAAEVQGALDSATLAAASTAGTDEVRITAGEKYYAKNFANSSSVMTGVPAIVISDNGKVTATVEARVTTDFMGLLGINDVVFNKNSEVTRGGIGNVEIVFVLDYSSSMADQYVAMRDAVVSLINTITENGTSTNVKIGLVPFAKEVHVTVPGQYVIGGTAGVSWSNCTVDRKWPFTVAESSPTSVVDSKWGRLHDNETPTPADFTSDCNDYVSNQLTTRPLTTAHGATIAQLMAMTPYEGTNLAVGLQFGWQVISPNAPWTQGASYADTDWKKVIIMLSDGEHNKNGYGPGGVYTDAQGFNNVSTVCENVKAQGILMITVAYELDSEEAEAQLKSCASASQYYLEGNESEIAERFDSISELLQNDWYISR